MPTRSFPLPDLGEGLTEGEIVSWSVAIGDTVELNQIIAEIETAKALVEIPSPYAGIVTALHFPAGTTVDVGTPLIDIDTSAESDQPLDATAARDGNIESPADNGNERIPVLVGYGVASESTSTRRRATRATPAGTNQSEPASSTGRTGRPLAKPPVRFLAKQNGIDLSQITPTGPHGLITRADVAAHLDTATDKAPGIVAAADAAAPTLPSAAVLDETRTPIKGVRKHTAAAMVTSAFTAPHVTEFMTVDITPSLELIDALRSNHHFTEVRITPLALLAKATLIALRTNPSLNSRWDDQAQEIVTKYYVNLGIAAATTRGLIVPNIKNAHKMGLRDLAMHLTTLTRIAKEGRTSPEDLAEGTITITNIGVFGVDSGTPILNPGEAAILCFGAIRKQPWEHHGDIALRSVTTLSLSFDHRLVDGEQGSRFLSDIAGLLADPLEFIALG